MCSERIRDFLRAATRKGPAELVPRDAEHQSEGGGRHEVERQHRMRRQAGEEGARAFTSESALGETACRTERAQAETSECYRVMRQPKGAKQLILKLVPITGQRSHELVVSRAVSPQRLARRRD